MRERMMPSNFETQPSEYAGQEPQFEKKQIMQTTSGERVVIMDYLKAEGLYVVSNVDKPEVISPAYKISPDKLVIPEAEKI